MKRKTAFILPIVILALSGCNFADASSNSIDSSSNPIESSGKPYDPACGFTKGYCLFDIRKNIPFKNMEEFDHENIIFEEKGSSVYMYVGNAPKKYSGSYVYASDVNCDGYLDLIFGSYFIITNTPAGFYTTHNYFHILDLHNDKDLFVKSIKADNGSKEEFYYPYLESCEQMAVGVNTEEDKDIQHIRHTKVATIKFALNDKEEMRMVETQD